MVINRLIVILLFFLLSIDSSYCQIDSLYSQDEVEINKYLHDSGFLNPKWRDSLVVHNVISFYNVKNEDSLKKINETLLCHNIISDKLLFVNEYTDIRSLKLLTGDLFNTILRIYSIYRLRVDKFYEPDSYYTLEYIIKSNTNSLIRCIGKLEYSEKFNSYLFVKVLPEEVTVKEIEYIRKKKRFIYTGKMRVDYTNTIWGDICRELLVVNIKNGEVVSYAELGSYSFDGLGVSFSYAKLNNDNIFETRGFARCLDFIILQKPSKKEQREIDQKSRDIIGCSRFYLDENGRFHFTE